MSEKNTSEVEDEEVESVDDTPEERPAPQVEVAEEIKEIRELKEKIPGRREEEVSIVSILNGIASTVQREMASTGTSLVTIVITGRHPENSGVFEIECPEMSDDEKVCAKLGSALTMSEHLGKVRAEVSSKIK